MANLLVYWAFVQRHYPPFVAKLGFGEKKQGAIRKIRVRKSARIPDQGFFAIGSGEFRGKLVAFPHLRLFDQLAVVHRHILKGYSSFVGDPLC
jgi:hypothetical protein